MSTGALLTIDGLRAVLPEGWPDQFLVEYAPGADGQAAYASLRRDFGRTVPAPCPPTRSRTSGGSAACRRCWPGCWPCSAATLGHLLVTSVPAAPRTWPC